MRRHHLQLGLAFPEPDPGNVISLGERGHRLPEPLPELAEQHRRGEREPQVPGQERHHLRTGLQDRHVGVEIDPVQALDIQRDMPIEHVVHRDDPLHHATSVRSSQRSRDPVRPASDRCPSHPATGSEAPRPASNLGGPRLASLLLQPQIVMLVVPGLGAVLARPGADRWCRICSGRSSRSGSGQVTVEAGCVRVIHGRSGCLGPCVVVKLCQGVGQPGPGVRIKTGRS